MIDAAAIQKRLDQLVKDGGAPGFQLGLGWKDRSLGVFMSGTRFPHSSRVVLPETWFDLASLTKIISTSSLMMIALQEGKIKSLDDHLQAYFPSFQSELKSKTIADLLHHRAGLPPVFEALEPLPTREERIRFFVAEVDKNYQPHPPRYSDVGFMLLGILLENLYGQRLSAIFDEKLGSEDLAYGPFRSGFDSFRGLFRFRTFASCRSYDDPTEVRCGSVQDLRAEWMMGDAGHAGLFGTADGIEDWAVQIFRAYHGKDVQISDQVARLFFDWKSSEPRFLGGFDRPTPPSQAGSHFPNTTVGHLGFTGTSFWMDLESGARVSLLGHRFSEGYDPERLRQLRPDFHDWLWDEVFRKL